MTTGGWQTAWQRCSAAMTTGASRHGVTTCGWHALNPTRWLSFIPSPGHSFIYLTRTRIETNFYQHTHVRIISEYKRPRPTHLRAVARWPGTAGPMLSPGELGNLAPGPAGLPAGPGSFHRPDPGPAGPAYLCHSHYPRAGHRRGIAA